MKRFLAILIISLAVLAGISAETILDSATLNVSTTLTNEMFAVQHIGFTELRGRDFISNEADMDDYPKDMADGKKQLDIEYKLGDEGQPIRSFYIFYKVIGVKPLTLVFSTTGKLTNSDPDNPKTIDFHIKVHDNAPWPDSTKPTGWECGIPLSTENYYEAGLYPVDIIVDTKLNPSYVSDTMYTSTISLKIIGE